MLSHFVVTTSEQLSKRASKKSSPLYEAIRARNLKAAKKLLAQGISCSKPPAGGDGRTPLQLAIDYRSDEVALALLDAGADLDLKALNLVWAVCTKRADVVQRLIDAGAELNARSFMGTPVQTAARMGLVDITRRLLAAGADPNEGRADDVKALEDAIKGKQTATALMLLEAGARPESSSHLTTLLGLAAHHRDTEIFRALLKAGADPNQRTKVYSFTDEGETSELYANASPLIIASRLGEPAMVEALLAANADLYLRDEKGVSALEWARHESRKDVEKLLAAAAARNPEKVNPDEALIFAAEKGELKQVKAMLEAGGNPNARDPRSTATGWTPLMHAAANGHTVVAAALLAAGADISAKDEGKDSNTGFGFIYSEGGPDAAREAGFQMWRTPLAYAAANGQEETGRLLIERGADVKIVDRAKAPPLHLAAEAGSAGLVTSLLSAGADLHARDRSKELAVHLAARQGHVEVLRVLLNAGAKVDVKNGDGNTPLKLAASARHPKIITLLLKAGADIGATNPEKETALHRALGTQHLIQDADDKGRLFMRYEVPISRILDTVRVLVEAGADTNAKNKYDETPKKLAGQLVNLAKELKGLTALLKPATRGTRLLR